MSKHGIVQPAGPQHVDRPRMLVELDVLAGEGSARQGEPVGRARHDLAVPRIGNDEHERALGAEVSLRALEEPHMTDVRRVEHPAEDQSHRYSSVSSPTSTSSPDRAPAWRRASSSSPWPGAAPATR